VEDKDSVQRQFKDHVLFKYGRYVVSLLWKDSCLSLLDNNLFRRLTGRNLIHMQDMML
jgi:hypothetical protein